MRKLHNSWLSDFLTFYISNFFKSKRFMKCVYTLVLIFTALNLSAQTSITLNMEQFLNGETIEFNKEADEKGQLYGAISKKEILKII